MIFLLVFLLFAAQAQAALIDATIAGFPSNPAVGTTRIATDGITEVDCTVGGGHLAVLCTWDGGAWVPGGAGGVTTIASGTDVPATCTPGDLEANGLFLDTDDGVLYFCEATDTFTALNIAAEADTLQSVFDRGKTITNATNQATAFQVGGWCIFEDATEGPTIKPCTDSNVRTRILDGYTWGLRDVEGDADMFIVDPDAATKKAMWAFQSGYYPLKSFSLDARAWEGDGTNCPARPTVATVGNMPMPTYICTENNSSRLRTKVKMRNDWDGGVIYVELHYAQTAADTGSVAYEVAAACRASGTAFNGTYGTEVEVDDAAVTGSGAIDSTLSAAITPNGTCAAKDWLFLYVDVDATDNPTTAAATLHFVSADVFYSSTSLSH